MFRKELLVICSLAVLVFLLVAVASSFVGHTVQEDASMIALDTLPGLVDAGAAMSRMQENWLRVHLLDHAASAGDRAALIQRIKAETNEDLWREYRDSIFETEDRRNFDQMMAARTEFLRLREQFFAAILAEHLPEARAFLDSTLAPAYQRYEATSKTLFEYNARLGRARAEKVVRLSRAAPLVMAGLCVIVFAFGVLVGLRGAFTGLNLASRVGKS